MSSWHHCDARHCPGHEPIDVAEIDGRRLALRCYLPGVLAQVETLCAIISATKSDTYAESRPVWRAYELLLQAMEREYVPRP